jgi:hypothetical protein
MVDVFGPLVVYNYLGYPAVVLGGLALWRPAILGVAGILLGAMSVFRLFRLWRIARAVRKILTWAVGEDAIVISAPRRGVVRVQVGGHEFAALEAARIPNRPKVGQRVGVLMDAARSDVLLLLG